MNRPHAHAVAVVIFDALDALTQAAEILDRGERIDALALQRVAGELGLLATHVALEGAAPPDAPAPTKSTPRTKAPRLRVIK